MDVEIQTCRLQLQLLAQCLPAKTVARGEQFPAANCQAESIAALALGWRGRLKRRRDRIRNALSASRLVDRVSADVATGPKAEVFKVAKNAWVGGSKWHGVRP